MKKIFKLSFLIIILLLGWPSLTVLASGDGSGGENNNAFDIVSSTVDDGEKNVNIDREIKFVFSKNVANIAIVENNRQCFSMVDSSGNAVPFEVVTFDDQLEREKRNDIIIKPEALKEAEEYTITISPNLQPKNGDILGKEIKYTFSTPGYISEVTGGDSALTDSNPLSQWWIAAIALVVVAAAAFALIKRKKNAQ